MKVSKIKMDSIMFKINNRKKNWKQLTREKFKESCKKSWMN